MPSGSNPRPTWSPGCPVHLCFPSRSLHLSRTSSLLWKPRVLSPPKTEWLPPTGRMTSNCYTCHRGLFIDLVPASLLASAPCTHTRTRTFLFPGSHTSTSYLSACSSLPALLTCLTLQDTGQAEPPRDVLREGGGGTVPASVMGTPSGPLNSLRVPLMMAVCLLTRLTGWALILWCLSCLGWCWEWKGRGHSCVWKVRGRAWKGAVGTCVVPGCQAGS